LSFEQRVNDWWLLSFKRKDVVDAKKRKYVPRMGERKEIISEKIMIVRLKYYWEAITFAEPVFPLSFGERAGGEVKIQVLQSGSLT